MTKRIVHTLATFATVKELAVFVKRIQADDILFEDWVRGRLAVEKTPKPLNEAGHHWRVQFIGAGGVPDGLAKRIEQATGGAE